MEIISADDLALRFRDASLADDDSFVQVVDLTNELITEEWTDTPVGPAPIKIRLLAFGVAERAWTHDPSTANIESITRSADDASRTERYRSSGSNSNIFLTDAELAILQGRRTTRSVRLVSYGEF